MLHKVGMINDYGKRDKTDAGRRNQPGGPGMKGVKL